MRLREEGNSGQHSDDALTPELDVEHVIAAATEPARRRQKCGEADWKRERFRGPSPRRAMGWQGDLVDVVARVPQQLCLDRPDARDVVHHCDPRHRISKTSYTLSSTHQRHRVIWRGPPAGFATAAEPPSRRGPVPGCDRCLPAPVRRAVALWAAPDHSPRDADRDHGPDLPRHAVVGEATAPTD